MEPFASPCFSLSDLPTRATLAGGFPYHPRLGNHSALNALPGTIALVGDFVRSLTQGVPVRVRQARVRAVLFTSFLFFFWLLFYFLGNVKLRIRRLAGSMTLSTAIMLLLISRFLSLTLETTE